MAWLMSMCNWLKHWHACSNNTSVGFLSADTFLALTHTLESLVLLVKYLFAMYDIKFVLCGKFQTDNLESRVGQYRQMSGGNSLVSVEEVLYNERKLHVKTLLKIHSRSNGAITVRDFLQDFSSESVTEPNFDFVNNFPFCSKCSNYTI